MICKWCKQPIKIFRAGLWILDTTSFSSICTEQPQEKVNGYLNPHEPQEDDMRWEIVEHVLHSSDTDESSDVLAKRIIAALDEAYS